MFSSVLVILLLINLIFDLYLINEFLKLYEWVEKMLKAMVKIIEDLASLED